jgi:hypothetical protein
MSEEQEDMSEEQEDMCLGEHEWEHEEHQSNGRIDSATYDIHECCHSLQSARVHAESVAVAVCMGQHVRLGGPCSPI